MLPYCLILVLLLFYMLINAVGLKGAEEFGLVSIIVLMIVVAGFRGLTVGTDTLVYSNMYYRIAGCSNLIDAFSVSTITAPVYVAYAWILGRIGFSHQALLLLNAAITNIGIAIFIKRTSDRPLLSILIYLLFGLYFQSLNGMRQYAAIGIALNAYLDIWISGPRKFRAWFLIGIASGIHSTALILLPGFVAVLYIRRKECKNRTFIVVLIASILFASVLVPLSNLFIRFFPTYSMYNGIQNVAIFSGSSEGRIRYLYAVLLVICFFGIFTLRYRGGDDWNADVIRSLLPLCIISSVVGLVYGTSSLINRLLWFYMPGYISIIPAIVKNAGRGWAELLKLGIAAVLVVWFVAQLIENQDEMLPYLTGVGLFQ